MATTFLEPGGDATFDYTLWASTTGTPTVVTDIVHGAHIKSLKPVVNAVSSMQTATGVCADAGTRISFYLYVNAYPTSARQFAAIMTSGALNVLQLRLTTTGVLRVLGATAQIGSDGATLALGRWYRITLAFTIGSTTVNRVEVFVDGTSSISITNATITRTGASMLFLGYAASDATQDVRYSDLYVDNSNALTDPGDIWVTAKRPVSNGTTNGFTTQIGAGGSSYGTGHAPQVNERPLSVTNGWSMVGVGNAVTEEYTVETAQVGDFSILGTIVDYVGWVYASSLLSETASIVVGGASSNIALTSANTMFTKVKGSATYPAGNTDIGIVTATTVTTVSLFECGVLVAWIPSPPLGVQASAQTQSALAWQSGWTPPRPISFAPLTLLYGDQPPVRGTTIPLSTRLAWQATWPAQSNGPVAPLTLAYGDNPPLTGRERAGLMSLLDMWSFLPPMPDQLSAGHIAPDIVGDGFWIIRNRRRR